MAAAKRSNGSWYVDFYFGGSRIRRKSPINTKRGAENYEKHLINQLMDGKDPFKQPEKNREMLFRDFVPMWLKTYVKPNNKDSEYKSKESILRCHLLPFFGGMRLSEIGVLEIEQFKARQMDMRLSPKTVNNHLGVLRKSLVCARDWKKIDSVPRFQPLKAQKPKIEWLTPREQRLLSEAETAPLWHLMIQLGLQTGMRVGELMALHWEDVDLRTGMVTIRYNLQDSGKISSTKSSKIREVPLGNMLVLELVEFKKSSRTKRLFEKTPEGTKMNRQKATRALKALCEDVGIRPISWHILRHTFATNLCSRGAPIRTVQELLGHSDIRMTERYSHVGAEQKRAAIQLLTGDLTTFGHYMVTEQTTEPELVHVRPFPKQQ